ncbi:maleylacetate reductase [Bradyrhizobium sp. RD5-C2]|uniref:maleylacetate reductase n=1 Tax=Bradyrhizobium sp. RD5-C2 TaxID=244562 RepID=UPI001CC5F3E5|nr:maleylacetate reductase [Bradyrhizobium sp. RD5-C2]GIQ78265.1 maleylacetate reductase [Bradyrhizobium sp. RD5-C2]
MIPFVYESLPSRVIFGRGTVGQVGVEIERLGAKRVIILTTAEQSAEAERISRQVSGVHGATFNGAVMHTPLEVTNRALQIVQQRKIDGILAIGGGSTIGLSKAIALRTDLPQLVIPTTYAGSEMTPILGQTENGIKTTQRTAKVLPETVIYDVDLTLSLPAKMSVVSAINAMAHAAEALYATNTNPVLSMMAEAGIAALYRGLPIITKSPENIEARSHTLYGAWLCAVCLGTSNMALHHKLCHVLGGSFNLPHAETHAIILPHAIAYNSPVTRDAIAALKRALGGEGVAGRIFDLTQSANAPTALRDLGMPENGIDRAAEIALASPYANPRPIEPALLRRLIVNAWSGVRPDHSSYVD